MATTFQNQSDGRLLLNVVTGGEPAEQKAFGDFLSKDERYARTDEFLSIVRKLWEHGDPFDYAGKHLRVEQARLVTAPETIARVQEGLRRSESEGQKRMLALHEGRPEDLEIYPHLEEAYWFGESVLPLLARDNLWQHPAGDRSSGQNAVPFAV